MEEQKIKSYSRPWWLSGWFLGIALGMLLFIALCLTGAFREANSKEPLFWFDQPQNQEAFREYGRKNP